MIEDTALATESVATPRFESVLLTAGSRTVRRLDPIAPTERYLLHLATMLSQLDGTIIELCTPGHRRGRGFVLTPVDGAGAPDGLELVTRNSVVDERRR